MDASTALMLMAVNLSVDASSTRISRSEVALPATQISCTIVNSKNYTSYFEDIFRLRLVFFLINRSDTDLSLGSIEALIHFPTQFLVLVTTNPRIPSSALQHRRTQSLPKD
jgi:hypothetical protein